MSRSLGSLTLDLVAQVGGFEKGFDSAARTAQTKSKEIERQARDSAGVVEAAWSTAARSIGGAFGAISAGALFTKFIQETSNAQDEQAQLAAVLRSTGQAAGYNADQLNKMADAISKSSRFSAGEINVAQTALLAFTGIAGDQFPKALQAAADMAARTGTSIASAAEKIGRALDVPSKGLSALSEQGFRFDDTQKKLVTSLENTGRVAEAQAVILDALTSTYGGAAEAARNNLGGALAALKNNIDDLFTGEDGTAESLRKSLEGVNTVLESDGFKSGLTAAAEAMRLLAPSAAAFVAVKLGTSLLDTAKNAVVARAEIAASAAATRTAAAASVDYARAKLAEAQATVASTAGFSRLSAVQQTLIPAQRALTAATDAHAVAMRSASVAGIALSAIGGPLGALNLAITAGVGLWAAFGRGTDDAKKSTLDLKTPIDELTKSFNSMSAALQRRELNRIAADLKEAGKQASEAYSSLRSLAEVQIGSTDLQFSPAAVGAFGEFIAQITKIERTPQAFADVEVAIDAAVQKFLNAAGVTGDLRVKFEEMAAEAVEAARSTKTLTDQSNALAGAQNTAATAVDETTRALEAQRKAAEKAVTDFADKYATRVEKRDKEIREWTERLQRPLDKDELARINKAFEDTSASRASASTDTSAAQRIAAIQAQIAEQETLSKALATYGLEASKVNAGDKLLLQIQQQLSLAVKDRTGKLTDAMLAEDKARAQVLSNLIRENDEKQRSLKLTEDIENYSKSLQAAQLDLGQSLGVLASGWGKTAEEQQIAAAQARIYRDAEKQIDAVLKAGLPNALQNIAQIEDTADAHAQVTAMLMGRIQAEQGAQQLQIENRRFAAESILDETQRAAALLKIDEDNWRERIRITAEGSEERRKLEEQFDIWLKNQAMRPIIEAQRQARQQTIDDWVETIDGVGDVFREGFADMLNGGTNSWEAFTKSLATTFKTTVADAIYKSFVKPIIVNLVANAAGAISGDASIASAVSKAAGGSGNVLNIGSSLGSIGDSIFGGSSSVFGALGQSSLFSGTSFGAGLQVAGSTGLLGGLSTAGNLASIGQFGAAFGAALPAIGTALTAVKLVTSLFGNKSKPGVGNYGLAAITGAGSVAANDESLFFGDRRGYQGQSQVLNDGLTALGDQIAAAAKIYGGSAEGLRLYAQTAYSPDGKGASGGTAIYGKSGQQVFGSAFDGTNEQLAANLQLTIQRSLLAGLKESDLAPQFARVLNDAVDLGTATADEIEQITATLESVRVLHEAFDGLSATFPELAALGYKSREALASVAGGLEALTSNLSTYYENFYTESERMANSLSQMTEAAAAVGVTLPDTKEEFRALVESLDLTTEGGQKAYTTLIGLSGSFAQFVEYLESLPEAVDAVVVELLDPARAKDIVGAAMDEAQRMVSLAQKGANDAFTILSNAIQTRRNEIQTAFDLVATSLKTGIDSAQASVTKLTALSSRLKSTLDSLAQQLDPDGNRRSAQDRISQALSVAQLTGILPSADDLENALSVIAQPSEGLFSTFEEYQADFLKTANDIAALNKLTGTQLSTEERTLKALQDSLRSAQEQYESQMAALDAQLELAQRQLEEAMGTRLAVLSVEEAVTNLSAAITALAVAQKNVPAAVGGGGVLAGLSDSEKAVYDAYKSSGLGYLDAEGFKFWTDAITNGANVADIINQIKDINEAKNSLVNGSHASGLWSVPWDGYIAELHAGETVLPSDEARAYRALQNAPDMNAPGMLMASGLQGIREEVAGLRAETRGVLRETKRSADTLDASANGGAPIMVEMA